MEKFFDEIKQKKSNIDSFDVLLDEKREIRKKDKKKFSIEGLLVSYEGDEMNPTHQISSNYLPIKNNPL